MLVEKCDVLANYSIEEVPFQTLSYILAEDRDKPYMQER
jgi:hypothetical protein